MKIKSTNNREYGIVYSMVKSKDNNWKVRNIVVEGINIGIQFRNQFAAAFEQYKTIDGVTANWNSIMKTQFQSNRSDSKNTKRS